RVAASQAGARALRAGAAPHGAGTRVGAAARQSRRHSRHGGRGARSFGRDRGRRGRRRQPHRPRRRRAAAQTGSRREVARRLVRVGTRGRGGRHPRRRPDRADSRPARHRDDGARRIAAGGLTGAADGGQKMSTHGTTGRFQREELVGKYLTFALGNEEYSVPVLKVREIIKIMDITAVPQVPEYVKGVVNLRGKVIPVVDLRLKFGFPAQDYTERTCIIVVEVA